MLTSSPAGRLVATGCLAALLLIVAAPTADAQPADSAETRVTTAPTANLSSVDPAWLRDLQARMVGPTRGGRVTAVEGHPAHPHTFYMGGAGGSGVWRTTDAGQSWTNLSDGQGFRSTSIGAIEVTEADTSVVYVGTGTDGIRANVTTGRGMYKSTDAGGTWSFLGLEDAGQIGAVEAHPDDPDRVYVAALGHPFGPNEQRGVFRSTDGGASWEKVLYASDSTGAIDLELHPTKPNVLYAAMWRGERKPWTIISGAAEEDGLYKSTDGGDTWTPLSGGLPTGLVGKIDLAVTPAAPDRVYALVEAPGPKQGLYRSDDAGTSWTQTSDRPDIMSRPFYFTNITAHPTNPDRVYVGNVRYWTSSDGGESFKQIPATHADVHDLWINPETPRLQVQGNDGGATVTLDGGRTWSTQHNQPTAELYQVNVDDAVPYWLYAGQQDNTTIAVPSLPPAEPAPAGPEGWWRSVGGCETGPAVPQPNSPVVFANCKGRFARYSAETGQAKQFWVGSEYMYGRNPAKLEQRFQRVVPIEISPHDSSVVYHASQYVHKTTDGGHTWTRVSPDLTAFKPEYQVPSGGPITRDITGEEHFSALYAVQVSPHDPDVIWAGSNDGPVHVTRNGGDQWTEVTPPDVPPNGRVDAIEPSAHTPGTAYVAIQRRLLDDFAPYVYRTTDYGATWTRLTDGENGIPADYPVRSLREDPERPGLLYAGTDFGLFVSMDDGAHWQSLQQNLPVTPITGLRVHRGDLVMATMGRSFWILDTLSPLRQLTAETMARDRHLFAPAPAMRMRYDDTPGGYSPSHAGPEYPEPGAVIDVYLAEQPDRPIALDVLAGDGTLVRRLVGVPADSAKRAKALQAGRAMKAPGPPRSTADTVQVHAGHNRIRWDLRHPGPTPATAGEQAYFGAGAGPLVVPGDYRVRLTAGDTTQTQPLEIRIDPRVQNDGVSRADLQAQLDLNLRMRDAIGTARATAQSIDTMRTRLADAVDRGAVEEEAVQATRATLDSLHRALSTSTDGSYPPPMLIDQLEYLYYQTLTADQRPGQDAVDRFETLKQQLDALRSRWQSVRASLDLPAATSRR